MKKLFIDIGGTHLRSEVCDGDDIIQESIYSNACGLLEYIDKKLAHHPQIDFIGISYAGQVDKGVITAAPNIHIDTYAIVSEIMKRYGVRTEIDNDLNCAVRAEAVFWKSQNIAALFVGTGIGAAIIDHGILMRGSHNMAFEIGHIPYKYTPLVCGCGRSNCIELYASGSGMAKWLKYYGIDHTFDLEQLKGSESENERMIAEEFEVALLHAAGVLVTLANPELLVLGGGIIESNPYLATLLREKLKGYALSPVLQNLRIETSVLENAPLSGAKLLETHHG